MVNPKPIEFLEELQGDYPDLVEDIGELASLYTRKLWHQLTLKLEACFQTTAFNRGDLPIRLFQSFISDFAHKINLLKLAHFAVHTSKFFPNPAASVDFLNSVVVKLEELKTAKAAQPILFLRMHVAQHKLETGAVAECKASIEAGKDTLETLSDVDPSVSAAVYYVTSLYHKSLGNFAEYYRSTLMYLSFVSSDTLPEDFKARLAVDVSLAALLGEEIYSFGQLLQHPIVNALQGGSFAWLHELLEAFNSGDLHRYDELCIKHAAALNAQPALVANERRLREKITIMSLLDLISNLPPDDRRVALGTIAARTKLDVDGVEFLLMKALALRLIEGSIDEVDGVVAVTWVTPRVLTRPQVAGLRTCLGTWLSKVSSTVLALEQESVGV